MAVSKHFRLLALFMCAVFMAHGAHAQIKGARDYMKRILPPEPPKQAAPQRPAPAQRPVPPQAPRPAAPPQAPADPAKAQAAKEESLRKTIEFQKKRAEEGSATSQYDLGTRYLNGDGLRQDKVLARKWLTEASKNGHAQATQKLKELDQPSQDP